MRTAGSGRPDRSSTPPDRFSALRRFGTTGSILMAIGGLGVGAQPVMQNPVRSRRLLGLLERTQAASATMVFVGLATLILAWLLLGRLVLQRSGGHGPQEVGDLGRLRKVFLLWGAPLVFAPPMFSQDVYSYLAHGMAAALGRDPYRYGPAGTLGQLNVFTRSVPTIWQDTPSPYGPLFLIISRAIAQLTGQHLVVAVLVHRLVALAGVAMVLWAIPCLARRRGTDEGFATKEVGAFWLGALNPLVFLHLIAGAHNDSLMMGLMLVGVELCLRGIDEIAGRRSRPWGMLAAGAVLITGGAMVKIPAELALGFVGVALARKIRVEKAGAPQGVVVALAVSAGFLGAVSLLTTLALNVAGGRGFEWTHTLGAATKVLSWLSPPTIVGRLTGYLGELIGLGNHTGSVLSVTWTLTTLAAGCAVVWLLLISLNGKIHPVGGLGVAMLVIVVLLPIIHTWYTLWALLPLSAWVVRADHRKILVVVVTVLSFMAYPSGGFAWPTILAFSQLGGIAVAAAFAGAVFGWDWLLEPWRSRQGRMRES